MTEKPDSVLTIAELALYLKIPKSTRGHQVPHGRGKWWRKKRGGL